MRIDLMCGIWYNYLNVYQKNARAISFYQREGFIIQCEGLDEATGEKEYTMLWKRKSVRLLDKVVGND